MPKEQAIKKNIQEIRQFNPRNERTINPEDLFINFQQPINQTQRLTEFDDFNFGNDHTFSFLYDEEEEARDLEDFCRMNQALEAQNVETNLYRISVNDPHQEERELTQWLNDLERILNERTQDNDSTTQSVSSPFTLFSHDAHVLREPPMNVLQQSLELESLIPRPYRPENSETRNELQSQLHPSRRPVLMNRIPSSLFLPEAANMNIDSSQSLLGPITTTTTTQTQNASSSTETEDRGTKHKQDEKDEEIKPDDEDENSNQRSFKRAK